MWKKSIVASLGLLIVAAPAWAGVVFEVETTHHRGSSPQTETTQAMVEGQNITMGITASGNGERGDAIYRGDRREMIVVDHGEKSYFVMNKATAQELGGQVSSAMQQMQEALKNVPEDQRALVEQMMKKQMGAMQQKAPKGPAAELKKTGRTAEKNGYPCVEYETWVGGKKTHELWVTDWSNIEGSDEAADAFLEMANFFEEIMDTLSDETGLGGLIDQAGIQNTFTQMRDLDGFPVVTREFGDDGDLESESFLRSARRQTIDPDAFEPPSGYKRQEMFSPSN